MKHFPVPLRQHNPLFRERRLIAFTGPEARNIPTDVATLQEMVLKQQAEIKQLQQAMVAMAQQRVNAIHNGNIPPQTAQAAVQGALPYGPYYPYGFLPYEMRHQYLGGNPNPEGLITTPLVMHVPVAVGKGERLRRMMEQAPNAQSRPPGGMSERSRRFLDENRQEAAIQRSGDAAARRQLLQQVQDGRTGPVMDIYRPPATDIDPSTIPLSYNQRLAAAHNARLGPNSGAYIREHAGDWVEQNERALAGRYDSVAATLQYLRNAEAHIARAPEAILRQYFRTTTDLLSLRSLRDNVENFFGRWPSREAFASRYEASAAINQKITQADSLVNEWNKMQPLVVGLAAAVDRWMAEGVSGASDTKTTTVLPGSAASIDNTVPFASSTDGVSVPRDPSTPDVSSPANRGASSDRALPQDRSRVIPPNTEPRYQGDNEEPRLFGVENPQALYRVYLMEVENPLRQQGKPATCDWVSVQWQGSDGQFRELRLDTKNMQSPSYAYPRELEQAGIRVFRKFNVQKNVDVVEYTKPGRFSISYHPANDRQLGGTRTSTTGWFEVKGNPQKSTDTPPAKKAEKKNSDGQPIDSGEKKPDTPKREIENDDTKKPVEKTMQDKIQEAEKLIRADDELKSVRADEKAEVQKIRAKYEKDDESYVRELETVSGKNFLAAFALVVKYINKDRSVAEPAKLKLHCEKALMLPHTRKEHDALVGILHDIDKTGER